jgi:hypothetical protein
MIMLFEACLPCAMLWVLAHEATRSVCFWISCAVGDPVLQLPIPDSVLVSVVLNSVRVFQRFKVAEINLYSVVVHFWRGRTASEQFNPKFQVAWAYGEWIEQETCLGHAQRGAWLPSFVQATSDSSLQSPLPRKWSLKILKPFPSPFLLFFIDQMIQIFDVLIVND